MAARESKATHDACHTAPPQFSPLSLFLPTSIQSHSIVTPEAFTMGLDGMSEARILLQNTVVQIKLAMNFCDSRNIVCV